ncbi:MAG TPA: aldehyde dehydrogenase family protein, partial [Myxococcota bacterium]|nr:aldehyde dehydrogenase family protein [Myxococcota bacterium]
MRDFLTDLGLTDTLEGASAGGFFKTGGDWLESLAPADGSVIAKIRQATVADYDRVVTKAQEVFERFRMLPAPKRGDMVREMGLKLRDKKKSLGQLVSLEMGKIRAEGEGEVQEMIDIADYAVGLSRQLYGLVIASERPMHRMSEQWHPLGVVG